MSAVPEAGDHLAGLAGELDTDEQIGLLAGQDTWTIRPIPAIGLGALKMSDGPNGIRGVDFVGGAPSLLFPSGTALASTWNPALVEEVGRALGQEAHSKGAHVHLAPTVNLHRGPLGGRNFECFSEDPFLTARMAVAYIQGVQSEGVASCVKHLVANDYEFERFTMSSEVDKRVLREVYLRPFEAALLEAGSWSVMSAYNKLWGTWCGEHRWLLTELLRDEWGWDGVVISDWGGTHTTAEALAAGLDIEMPGPSVFRGQKLAQVVGEGMASVDHVRRAAERVLRLAERTGVLDGPAAIGAGGGSSAGAGTGGAGVDGMAGAEERFDDDPARTDVARRAAVEGIVLLRNEAVDGAPVLPLAAGGLKRLAVIGPNAAEVHAMGGGSARVRPPYLISPLKGLTEALPGVEVVHEAGCPPATVAAALERSRMRVPEGRDDAGAEGLLLSFFGGRELSGAPIQTRVVRRSNLMWLGGRPPLPGVDPDDWSASAELVYLPRVPGLHHLHIRGGGRIRVLIDGAAVYEGEDSPERDPVPLRLEPGQDTVIGVEIVPPTPMPFLLGCDIRIEEPSDPARPAQAAALAASADAAVVVVGLDGDIESEGRDRTYYPLPAVQEDLIRQVVAANPKTVVVVNTGSPVEMAWAAAVPAVVQLWCAGQEAGRALADVLTGAAEASGRLPTTLASRIEDTPAYVFWPGQSPGLEPGLAPYSEGLHLGYRHYLKNSVEPQFWFGHGLSYTIFAYGPLAAAGADGGGIRATVSVTNTGERAGAEVVQLYLARPGSAVERPAAALAAFEKVWLDPGQTAEVVLDVAARELAHWDEGTGWTQEGGAVEVRVGSSASAIHGRARVQLG
ncbi:MAG TPA: glycoside hydrolase family 3 C-terminal domain-containing protein [Acidimicrobiales bacterium]|nr:glycoside hydrolase family 3 C-terminal domain-containing protein [Acidimicrobiales bacterium]